MSPQTVAELQNHGVTEDSTMRLEFFFYTNARSKAEGLNRALEAKGYETEFGTSASDDFLFVVTGTSSLLIEQQTVMSWTAEMPRLGFEHDCEFDGWGTNPDQ